MSRSHLTTVQNELVETLRLVECAGPRDSCDIGEELARFPPGTGLAVVRRELIRLAMENRGVDYSIDCFCHRGIWERFVSVRYEEGWEIDPETGIILSGRTEPEPETVNRAAIFKRERLAFEYDRAKRQAAHNRATGRTASKDKRSATNH